MQGAAYSVQCLTKHLIDCIALGCLILFGFGYCHCRNQVLLKLCILRIHVPLPLSEVSKPLQQRVNSLPVAAVDLYHIINCIWLFALSTGEERLHLRRCFLRFLLLLNSGHSSLFYGFRDIFVKFLEASVFLGSQCTKFFL